MKTYTITELSKECSMTASTLRYYEEIGLLPPVARTPSKQRVYTQEHIERLLAISCFKNTGMSISDIQKFFEYEKNEPEHIHHILQLLETYRLASLQKLQDEYCAYCHLLRKVDFYQAASKSYEEHSSHPKWEDFNDRDYSLQAKDEIFRQSPDTSKATEHPRPTVE